MKIILIQLTRLIIGGYPTAHIQIKFWAWKWNKKGNVKYLHFQTLVNHLKQTKSK